MPNRTLFPLAPRRRSLAGFVEGSDNGGSTPSDRFAELEQRLEDLESKLENAPAEKPQTVRVSEEEPEPRRMRSLLRRVAD